MGRYDGEEEECTMGVIKGLQRTESGTSFSQAGFEERREGCM